MKPQRNLPLDRSEVSYGRHYYRGANHFLKWLEQQLSNDNLHRTELVSRMDLKTNLPGVGGIIMHVGNLTAVNPYLKVVTLGTNLYRIPAFTVNYAFILIHCQKHLTGTVQSARIAHRILIFEDIGLVRLLR